VPEKRPMRESCDSDREHSRRPWAKAFKSISRGRGSAVVRAESSTAERGSSERKPKMLKRFAVSSTIEAQYAVARSVISVG